MRPTTICCRRSAPWRRASRSSAPRSRGLLVEDYMRTLQQRGLTDSYDLLTDREKEVLQLLAEGRIEQGSGERCSMSASVHGRDASRQSDAEAQSAQHRGDRVVRGAQAAHRVKWARVIPSGGTALRAVGAGMTRAAPHPAFGHPLPASRGEGLSKLLCPECPSPRLRGEGAGDFVYRCDYFSIGSLEYDPET